MDSERNEPCKLFSKVVFYISKEANINEDEYNKVREILLAGGAREAQLIDQKRTNSSPKSLTKDFKNQVTYIIANTIEFPEYAEAVDLFVNVARSSWVLKSYGQVKPLPLHFFSPNPAFFFSDVRVCALGLPEHDTEILYRGVQAMGGQWTTLHNQFTTHLVTLYPDTPEVKRIMKRRSSSSIKYVSSEWIDDCLRLRRRVDETPYLISSSKNDMIVQSPSISSPQDSDPPVKSKLLLGKRFFFGSDLQLSSRYSSLLKCMIETDGGQVVQQLDDANTYLGRYRWGDEYIRASQQDKEVGTIIWFYWMISRRAWRSPLRNLLHYPVPKNQIPGMDKLKISVSGFSGESRTYIDNLITACGAEYTRTLSPQNSYLITSMTSGQKYEAAQVWTSINTVNHLWLEHTFAKWEMQAADNPRYTIFTDDLNPMELLGQVQLDPNDLNEYWKQVGATHSKEKDPVWQDAIESEKNEMKHASEFTRNDSLPLSVVDNNQTESQNPDKESSPNKPYPQKQPNITRVAKISAKESLSVPVRSGGRAAKEKAAEKLKDDMEKQNEYDKRRKKSELPPLELEESQHSVQSSVQPSVQSSKRKSFEVTAELTPKKKNKNLLNRTHMKVLLTGYGELSSHDITKLSLLGVEIVTSPDVVTHVAAPKILRTEKFLCALAHGPSIITTEFIKDCLSADQLLPENKYILHDSEGESKIKCTLEDLLNRARILEAKHESLFQDIVINLTPNIKGGIDSFKKIISAHGGICTIIKAARAKKYGISNNENYPLVMVTSEADQDYIKAFKAFAKHENRKCIAVSTDWIVTSVLRMKVAFDYEFSVA
ncbi:uncharacterized protein V1516DRAFT_670305 [Lipomyces oligophaga]|uniref:uncharacterized protein n=1 Tax=Lipomyces oligophaga TaxID=45792 RepID=UPI0034CE99B3